MKVPVIVTHDGRFHADEILACVLLKFLPEFKDSDIQRSRDQKIIDAGDVVVDVGGVYDPERYVQYVF